LIIIEVIHPQWITSSNLCHSLLNIKVHHYEMLIFSSDIFYAYANEATRKSGVVFSAEEQAKLIDRDHNYGDYLLYQHFNKTFWEKMRKHPDLDEEVR